MLWFLWAAAAVIAVLFLISLYTYLICFHSPADRQEDPYQLLRGRQYEAVGDRILACTRYMDQTECEWVSIASSDGLKLCARYYHIQDGAPLQILFHGYRSMALRDCAGGFLLAKKLGFNILVPDQRAHAGSEGRTISFGICERMDCLAWVRYASNRFGTDTPIVLSGLSMGASTVLMASALPLPANVSAIMADSPYSSPADIIRKVSRDRHLPDGLAYPFVRMGARIYGGFDLEKTTAVKAVAEAKIPILLIHGEDDRFVPCRMSREICNASASRTELHLFPGAGHGLSYVMDPQRYEEITIRFLWSVPALRTHLSENEFVRKQLSGS